MNFAEAEMMVQTARENDRLLVEAVSSRWHPRMARAIEFIKAGNIGELLSIESSFTFPASIEGNYRLSQDMGGGALFDVGVYPLHVMAALIGDTAQAVVERREVNIGTTGVDLTTKWSISFDGSVTGNGLASFELPEDQTLVVRGANNSIEFLEGQVFTSWHSPSTLRLGDYLEEFEASDSYMLMIENFGKKIRGQDSWVLPLETSLSVQKMLDQIRAQIPYG